MTEREFKKGEVIFRQGDVAKSFFRIQEGCVGIVANYQEPDEVELTELTGGKLFGEMALIDCYPRSATAISKADGTKVNEFGTNEAKEFLEKNPDAVINLMKYLSDRLRSMTDDYNDACAVLREMKEEKQKGIEAKMSGPERLKERIHKHVEAWKEEQNAQDIATAEYLNDVKQAQHSEGFYKKIQDYPAGTVICREGRTVHCMYDIHWGRVGVYTGYGTDHEELITELYPNTFFGEAGMISDEPRSATVVALEDTTVEIIYEEDLEELLEKNPNKIFMILQHLTFRLRRITNSYLEACEEIMKEDNA